MFFRRLNWNVVGWFRTVSTISYAVILAGVVALCWHALHAPGGGFQPSHALRLGLSFTGGTDVTVKFDRPQTTADIARVFASIGAGDARVNTLGKASDSQPNERFTIETQTDFGDNPARLYAALGTLGKVDRSQTEIAAVGPSLGREYLINALIALLFAIAIQFAFIAWRFGWNYIFGLVVVIALVRDAAMMIGIYAIADRRADDAFLAAVLTVIGYSVMDTIVILDRIRENVRVMADQPYATIVNTSILQTMTRSVNTLATVVVTLVALFAFGGASLQNFAFALLVGICSGGYHSIFFSAPLVHVLRERQLAGQIARRGSALALERPRTVAEARAQAGGTASREAILAARRERRKKETRVTTGPAKYKRKRIAPVASVAAGAAGTTAVTGSYAAMHDDHELGDEVEYDDAAHEPGFEEELDPLDAQNAGVHDDDLARGHEEIHLAFEDDEDAGEASVSAHNASVAPHDPRVG